MFPRGIVIWSFKLNEFVCVTYHESGGNRYGSLLLDRCLPRRSSRCFSGAIVACVLSWGMV